MVAAGVAILNISAKSLLRCKFITFNSSIGIAKCESAHTKTSEIFSSMSKMFVVQFINTGIVIFLVNLQLDIGLDWFPIFKGRYDEFTCDWYKVVGSTIVSFLSL
jgi:hypothetical protein